MLENIQDVLIDVNRVEKYIVAKVISNKESKLVIRAYRNCWFHRDVLSAFVGELTPNDFQVECIGGGLIDVDFEKKYIRIFGRSSQFGQEPDRKQTALMLQEAFPEFKVNIWR